MGGDRDCPDDCTYVKWSNLSKADQKAQRRDFVAELRAKKYSQEQIGRMLGVSQQTISNDFLTLPITSNVQTDRGTDTLGRKKSTGRPKGSKQRRKNESAAAENAAKQIVNGEKTYPQIEKETGISNIVLRSAVAREEGRREVQADPPIDPSSLSLTAQQKLEAATRQHKQKLDAGFHQAVNARVQEFLMDTILPRHRKEQAEAKKIVEARRGIMDKATFNKIRRALHPDSRQSISDKVLAEAFDTFMALEKRLLNEKDSPTEFAKLPDTWDEWAKMKQQATAARKTKRAASTVAKRA
jgi:DNA-binding XRE family transcriptional regulator